MIMIMIVIMIMIMIMKEHIAGFCWLIAGWGRGEVSALGIVDERPCPTVNVPHAHV